MSNVVRRVFLALIVFMLGAGYSFALNVPTVISDNMVFQRNSSARVWGTAQPGEKISVTASWHSEPANVVADELGMWLVSIPTGDAAYKQTLVIKGESETLKFKNIMLGEVWICSGQSNMKFTVGKTIDVVSALKSPNPNVRLYNIGQRSSRVPMEDIPIDGWTSSAASNLESFSAVGYAFADVIQKQLGVPVGVINASYGGTSIESWMPEEEILNNELFNYGLNKSLEDNAKKWKGKERYFAGSQYNANIHPVINTTIAGVIWYQGCHNVATTAGHYDLLLERFIYSWRERFRNPELPFYVVQIAPHTYENVTGAILREKQALVANRLDHVEVIATIDQNERTGDIHPRNKQVVAERLAAAALGEHYGCDVVYKAPQYLSHKVEGNKIRVSFSEVKDGLKCDSDQIRGFQVAGMNGRFRLAHAEIEGNEVVVWSDKVKEPLEVRYCFDECEGNLFAANGLPVHPFRTDFDNGAKFDKAVYDISIPENITVKYSGCEAGVFVNNAKPWNNRNYEVVGILPHLVGCSYLAPRWHEAGESMPGVTITSQNDGYIYILVRDFSYFLSLENWEIIPCSAMQIVDPDKKNRKRGMLYLAKRQVKKGESVVLPSSDTNISGVIPIAKNIKIK